MPDALALPGKDALTVSGIAAGYGSARVLHGVDLAAAAGETTALLGRNGMGKSTLARTIAGLLPVEAGTVTMAGADVTALPPAERVARGLAYAPQEQALFQDLPVADNLRLALRSDRLYRDRLDEVVALFPRLRDRLRQAAGTLSGGEQKMLLLARALITRPRILVLDEISEGLQPSMVDLIAAALAQRVREQGTALVLIEQNIAFALAVAQRWSVLERGAVVASGRTGPETAATVADLLAL
jgi:branched-chain amino acid transport system ATP-binding protein